MRKIFLMPFCLFLVSCSSINSYLRDRNIVTSNETVVYRVLHNENDKKEEIVNKENEVENKKNVEIVRSINKVKETKPVVVVTENTPAVVEVKQEEEKKVEIIKNNIVNTIVSNNQNRVEIIKSEAPTKVEEKKPEVVKETVVKAPVISNVVKKEPVVNTKIVFDATDEKILEYISNKVVESKEQIKQKTIDSINKLRRKNINLTPKEFLAKAYENVKATNINSYILAAARVINNVERGKL